MGVDAANKPLAAIAHPNIHDVGPNVLLANACERVAQIVLRYVLVLHNAFKDTVEHFCIMRLLDLAFGLDMRMELLRDRDFFIFDLPAFTFGVSRDQEIAFEACTVQLAGPQAEIEHYQEYAFVALEFREL